MKKLVTSLSCFIVLNIYANNEVSNDIFSKNFKVTLEWLEDKPKSFAKDFYIIQYLKQNNISEQNATTAFEMARNKDGRIKKAYNDIVSTIPPEDLKCYRAKTEELLKQNDDRCLALGLTLNEAVYLTRTQLKSVISRIDNYPTLKNDLAVIAADNFDEELLKTNSHRFYRLFFSVGKTYRSKKFNKPLPSTFIEQISLDKDFNRFVKYIITNDNLDNLQKSLFLVKDNKEITHRTLFSLSLNALKYGYESLALDYLAKASKKAYFQMDKDKVKFWQYLITKNNDFLNEISKSWDNNIYSLYAKELLNIMPDNIVYQIDIPNTETSFNIYDQFEWIKILEDTKKSLDEKKLLKYQQLFTHKNTLPHYAFVLERFKKYRTQYFITPFEDVVNNYSTEEKVLIYSIARQESRFIPSAISPATAQGVMQIMPFLSKSIAEKHNESYNIYEQFKPEINIEYAKRHLRVLKKQFNNNPLFIAYAYNGGASYTKGQFEKGLFKNNGKYEPFFSMEMISYDETRRYGKKVLANYYIYNNHLNKENSIKLSSIFQSLTLQN